jgi:hypothetical protein
MMKTEVIVLNCKLVEVCQTGLSSIPTKEDATLFLHYRTGEDTPSCAELIADDLHAEIGFWWDGKTLKDYDGVFELPGEVIEALKARGFEVGESFMPDAADACSVCATPLRTDDCDTYCPACGCVYEDAKAPITTKSKGGEA